MTRTYFIERFEGPAGEDQYVATLPGRSLAYGVGSSPEEAASDLEGALEFLDNATGDGFPESQTSGPTCMNPTDDPETQFTDNAVLSAAV